MNAGGVVGGVVLVIVGLGIAAFGTSLYVSCTAVGGAPTSGSSGQTAYPSGCGAVLFVVVFGVLFLLVGLLTVARAARTTYVTAPWNTAVPPPIVTGVGAPWAGPPTAPRLRCPYCGALADQGTLRCPSCGAPF
ncbi:MAG: hypothetical protein L3J95_03425 [Thermoplasmata archaeon]|nr:hypothetical protein [Thermoplasmata archaeon]MCI4359458.1 hypothetical protein [Thermoplasmata archaeon]